MLSVDSDGAFKLLAGIKFLSLQIWKMKNTIARNTVINTHLIVPSVPPRDQRKNDQNHK